MDTNNEVSRSKEMNSMGMGLANIDKNCNAIKYFEKSIESDTDYFEPYYNKVKSLIACDDIAEAIDYLNEIINKDNNQKYAYYLKANILFFHFNNPKEAIENYNKGIFLGERNENIYTNLGRCLFSIGQNEQALNWIEKAEKFNQNRLDILFAKGEILTSLEKYEDAINIYDKILVQQVDNRNAYHFKAILFAQLKYFDEALNILQIAEELTGDSNIIEYDRALIYENKQDIKRALFHIDKALDYDNKNKVALLKKGYLLSMLLEYDRAKQIFNYINEIDPEDFEGIFNKANIHMLLKEYNEAFEIYDFILNSSQDNNQFSIYSYYLKGLCLKNSGDIDGAEKAYQTAIVFYSALSLKYSQDVQLMLLKANTLRDMGRYLEANEVYEYVSELNSNLGDAHLMRAKNYIYMSERDKAKEELKSAVIINPAFLEVIKIDDELRDIYDN